MRTALKLMTIYLGLSAFLVLLWLGLGAGNLPATTTQWLWLLLLAVPLQLAGELIGQAVWNNRATRFVEHKTAGKRLSVLRILYAFLMIVVICGLILAASYGWNLLNV